MTLDITYCANFSTCPAQHWCKRAMLFSEAVGINQPATFTTFYPEKGIDCEGFWKKGVLMLNALEDK
jgi:hypothetical protein